MKGRFLLNVIVRQGPAILELLSREDETLLVRRNPTPPLSVKANMNKAEPLTLPCPESSP